MRNFLFMLLLVNSNWNLFILISLVQKNAREWPGRYFLTTLQNRKPQMPSSIIDTRLIQVLIHALYIYLH